MKTKLFEVINDTNEKSIQLAQHRADLERKIEALLKSKASRRVKRAKINNMLIEMVNSGSSFSEHDHKTLLEARASI